MANFIPSKKEASDFNGGVQYINADLAQGIEGDALQADTINNLIESALYTQGIAEEAENVIQNAGLSAYPIGSLYISTQNTSPANLFGGSWEVLPNGYALWTADSGAGETIAAGLPNITGEFRYGVQGVSFLNLEIAKGAFFGTGSEYSYVQGGGNARGPVAAAASFNANNGASVQGIYGNSSTVQPPAYKIYAWKRTA